MLRRDDDRNTRLSVRPLSLVLINYLGRLNLFLAGFGSLLCFVKALTVCTVGLIKSAVVDNRSSVPCQLQIV